MGWASGTYIAEPVIEAIKAEKLPKDTAKRIYKAFLNAMTDADWDTVDEVGGIDPIFDEVVKEHYED